MASRDQEADGELRSHWQSATAVSSLFRLFARYMGQARSIQLPGRQPADPVVVDARLKARKILNIDQVQEDAEQLHRAGWPARRIRPATAPPVNSRKQNRGEWVDRVASKGNWSPRSQAANVDGETSPANRWKRAAAQAQGPIGLPGFTWREVASVYGTRVPPAVLGRKARPQTTRPASKTAWWTESPGGRPRPHSAKAGRSACAEIQSPRVKSAGAVLPEPDTIVAPLVIQPQRRPFSAAPVMMRGSDRPVSPGLTPRNFIAARAESRASMVRSKVDRKGLATILQEDGSDAFRAGDHRKAVELYTEALEEDPSNHAVYSNRSAAHRNLGKFEDALRDANKCIAIDAKFANGYISKGQALEGMGQWHEATKAYRVGLNFHPVNKTLMFAVRRVEEQERKKAQRTKRFQIVRNQTRTEPEPEPELRNKQNGEILGVMAGENTGRTIANQMVELFERAEREHDGVLTSAGLISSLRKGGDLPTQLGMSASFLDKHRAQFEEALRKVGSGSSDPITVDQFVSHFAAPIESVKLTAAAAAKAAAEMADEQTMLAMFNQIDTDGNGTLDRGEMDHMARVLDMNLNKAQMDAAWEFMDRDGSGEVDFDEFKKWHDVLTGKIKEKHAVQGKGTSCLKDCVGDSDTADGVLQRMLQLGDAVDIEGGGDGTCGPWHH